MGRDPKIIRTALIQIFGEEKVNDFPEPLLALMMEFYELAFKAGGNTMAAQHQSAMIEKRAYEIGYSRGQNDAMHNARAYEQERMWREDMDRSYREKALLKKMQGAQRYRENESEQLGQKQLAQLERDKKGYGPNHR